MKMSRPSVCTMAVPGYEGLNLYVMKIAIEKRKSSDVSAVSTWDLNFFMDDLCVLALVIF